MVNCLIVWVIASVAFALGWALCAGVANNKLRAVEEKRDELRKDRVRSRDMGE